MGPVEVQLADRESYNNFLVRIGVDRNEMRGYDAENERSARKVRVLYFVQCISIRMADILYQRSKVGLRDGLNRILALTGV